MGTGAAASIMDTNPTGSAPVGLTTGVSFVVLAERTIAGVRVFWPGGRGALTLRVTLYDSGGAVLAQTDQAVNAAALINVAFGAPVVVSGARLGELLTVGLYETSGAFTLRFSPGSVAQAAGNFVDSNVYCVSRALNAAGDAFPNNPVVAQSGVDLIFA
jgi:hypothetical protein